jgi:hypothetical protein
MLKEAVNVVLASISPSTYLRGYVSRPLLAADLVDGFFEHLAVKVLGTCSSNAWSH